MQLDEKVFEALLVKLKLENNAYFEQMRNNFIFLLSKHNNDCEAEQLRERLAEISNLSDLEQMKRELSELLGHNTTDERDRQHYWHLAVQDAIRELLELKENGEWFFRYQYQWFAIMVVLYENNWLMTHETKEFKLYLDPSHLNHILPEDYDALPNPNKFKERTPHEVSKARTWWLSKRDEYKNIRDGILPKTEDVFRKLLVKFGAK